MNHLTAYDSSSSEGEGDVEEGVSAHYPATRKATPPRLDQLSIGGASLYAGQQEVFETAVTPCPSGMMQQGGDSDLTPLQGHDDVGVASYHVGVARGGADRDGIVWSASERGLYEFNYGVEKGFFFLEAFFLLQHLK